MDGYRVTFKDGRLGRTRGQAPLEPFVVPDGDADAIADDIYKVARKRLLSSGIEVVVDLEAMDGTVYAGIHLGGSFTLEPVR